MCAVSLTFSLIAGENWAELAWQMGTLPNGSQQNLASNHNGHPITQLQVATTQNHIIKCSTQCEGHLTTPPTMSGPSTASTSSARTTRMGPPPASPRASYSGIGKILLEFVNFLVVVQLILVLVGLRISCTTRKLPNLWILPMPGHIQRERNELQRDPQQSSLQRRSLHHVAQRQHGALQG